MSTGGAGAPRPRAGARRSRPSWRCTRPASRWAASAPASSGRAVRPAARALPVPPPDGERALCPPLDLAARYAALSGDDNPIHLDEHAARRGGHPGPILHGLCTLGLAGQALLDALERGDVRPLRRLAGRFRRPVHPGQAITLRWWRNPLGARFDLRDERGHLLLDHGILETSWSHE